VKQRLLVFIFIPFFGVAFFILRIVAFLEEWSHCLIDDWLNDDGDGNY